MPPRGTLLCTAPTQCYELPYAIMDIVAALRALCRYKQVNGYMKFNTSCLKAESRQDYFY